MDRVEIYTNSCTDDTNTPIPPRLVQALLLCSSHISMISPRPDPILAELLELLRYYFRFLRRDSAGFIGWDIIETKASKEGRKERKRLKIPYLPRKTINNSRIIWVMFQYIIHHKLVHLRGFGRLR